MTGTAAEFTDLAASADARGDDDHDEPPACPPPGVCVWARGPAPPPRREPTDGGNVGLQDVDGPPLDQVAKAEDAKLRLAAPQRNRRVAAGQVIAPDVIWGNGG